MLRGSLPMPRRCLNLLCWLPPSSSELQRGLLLSRICSRSFFPLPIAFLAAGAEVQASGCLALGGNALRISNNVRKLGRSNRGRRRHRLLRKEEGGAENWKSERALSQRQCWMSREGGDEDGATCHSQQAIAKLLSSGGQSSGRKVGGLIQVVGEEADAIPPPAPAAEDEGPTMMEMMIAAQQEAQAAKQAELTKEQKEAAKTGFGGFKKGFFSKPSAAKAKPAPSAPVPRSATKQEPGKDDLIEVKAAPSSGSGAANRKDNKGVVLEEVQQAIDAQEHPLLKQVRAGDWVTPDLTAVLMSNPVLRAGLSHPKCQAALQLLQQDPKAAKEKFQHDREVSLFLQEFGKVMAEHFDKLGRQKSKQQQQQPEQQQTLATGSSSPELGPLQAKVLEKAAANPAPRAKVQEVDSEQQRVNQILQDPELRDLLMDGNMQRVLMECGDPVKFRQHLADPVTARKLRKLKDAGLVQIEM